MRHAILIVALLLASCGERAVESAVRETMKDPEAAKFRNVKECPNDKKVWFGEVNGKNSYGAYNGFTPFFYDGDEVYMPDHPRFDGTAGRCGGLNGLESVRQYRANQ